MPAEKKNIQQLYTSFPDNDTGTITAQDMRNLVASIQNVTGAGWGAYYDGTYTEASPRVITGGTKTKVTIDKSTSVENELPYDVSVGNGTFWDGVSNEFIPENIGDFYVMRFQFKAKSAITPMNITTQVEIPNVGVSGTQVIYAHDVVMDKGNNVTHAYAYVIPLFNIDVSSGATFHVIPSETASFWDFGLIVSRVYRGSLPLE